MATSNHDDGEVYYEDHYYCMDCGCSYFVDSPGLYDKCNQCGKHRNIKRGIEDAQ